MARRRPPTTTRSRRERPPELRLGDSTRSAAGSRKARSAFKRTRSAAGACQRVPDVQSARCLGGVSLPSTPRTTAATVAEAPCAFCAVCRELATVGGARCLRGCILRGVHAPPSRVLDTAHPITSERRINRHHSPCSEHQYRSAPRLAIRKQQISVAEKEGAAHCLTCVARSRSFDIGRSRPLQEK
jgi:hypothetical protein